MENKRQFISDAYKYGCKTYFKNFFGIILTLIVVSLPYLTYMLFCGMGTDEMSVGEMDAFDFDMRIFSPSVLFSAWEALLFTRVALQIYDTGRVSLSVFRIPIKMFLRVLGATFLIHASIMAPLAIGGLLLDVLGEGITLFLVGIFAVVGIPLVARFIFCLFFIVDRSAGIIESFRNSFNMTRSYWRWSMTFLAMGRILSHEYLFFLAPILFLIYAYIYRRLSEEIASC